MTAALELPQVLPGLHRVRSKRADGGVTEFWYAWRGGPRILRASAKSDALLAKEIARLTPAAIAAFEEERHPKADTKFLYGLITRYLQALQQPEFAHLSERTRSDRRKYLDRVRTSKIGNAELAKVELRSLESRRARSMLIQWRDQYAATPKTADELLGALSTVLTWAKDRGEIATNPVADFPRIYKVNRADVIWRPEDLAKLWPHCAPEFAYAVRFAMLTGIRLGDIVNVPWHAVGQDALVWQTNKSRGRRTIVIPITPELRKLLAEIPRRDATTILTSARERPWSLPGLESAMRRAKLDAQAHAEKVGGVKAESGIGHLRFHDLRGTAATNLVLAGLPLQDVATILGWELDKVSSIAARYVTAEAIGRGIVKRLGGASHTG